MHDIIKVRLQVLVVFTGRRGKGEVLMRSSVFSKNKLGKSTIDAHFKNCVYIMGHVTICLASI